MSNIMSQNSLHFCPLGLESQTMTLCCFQFYHCFPREILLVECVAEIIYNWYNTYTNNGFAAN
eukprot:UN25658